jgi:hypothetical protein
VNRYFAALNITCTNDPMDLEKALEGIGGEPETPWNTWVLGLGASAGACLLVLCLGQLLKWTWRKLKKAWELRRAGSPSSTPNDPNSPLPTGPLPPAEDVPLQLLPSQSGTSVEPQETASEPEATGPMIDLTATAHRSRQSLSVMTLSSRRSSGVGPPCLFFADDPSGEIPEEAGVLPVRIRDPLPSDPLASLQLPEHLCPPAAKGLMNVSGSGTPLAVASGGEPGPSPKS